MGMRHNAWSGALSHSSVFACILGSCIQRPRGRLITEGEGSVRPDPFIVKNCGPYAAEQVGRLLEMLHDRGAQFFQSHQIAEAYDELHSRQRIQ